MARKPETHADQLVLPRRRKREDRRDQDQHRFHAIAAGDDLDAAAASSVDDVVAVGDDVVVERLHDRRAHVRNRRGERIDHGLFHRLKQLEREQRDEADHEHDNESIHSNFNRSDDGTL